MHFAGKSFSQVCKNYPHLARSKKPHTIFVSIDYSTKSWSRFMSWIIELGILWLFITRTGICIRINPRQRFRRGQLLSYYGGESLSMSINYHVPIVNKNLTNILLSFSRYSSLYESSSNLDWGMKLYRLFCWIVFQYLQSINRFLHTLTCFHSFPMSVVALKALPALSNVFSFIFEQLCLLQQNTAE